MRGQQDRNGSLFSYVSIEEQIPASHPLRRIRKQADQALDRLNPTFCELYASERRPSVPPEQLLLASLLQAFSACLRRSAAIPSRDRNPRRTTPGTSSSSGCLRFRHGITDPMPRSLYGPYSAIWPAGMGRPRVSRSRSTSFALKFRSASGDPFGPWAAMNSR
jgi:hypothetical protein